MSETGQKKFTADEVKICISVLEYHISFNALHIDKIKIVTRLFDEPAEFFLISLQKQ